MARARSSTMQMPVLHPPQTKGIPVTHVYRRRITTRAGACGRAYCKSWQLVDRYNAHLELCAFEAEATTESSWRVRLG